MGIVASGTIDVFRVPLTPALSRREREEEEHAG
jgi:hypothetical protein